MRGKKFLSLLMSATLVAGLLAGCGKKNSSAGTNDLSSADLSGEANKWGWVVPEKTLEISVFAGEGDQEKLMKDEDGGKAKFDAWLLENLNVKINWQLYSTNMDEKLNLMLTANDYPEVITNMSDTMAEKFIAQKKALDLTEAIDKYGDNITRRYGKYMNLLKDSDGKIHKLANLYGENPNVAGSDFGIRLDYWKELNENKMYDTPEGYYETLKKVLANHPTNANGQKTYAASSTDKGLNFLSTMLGANGMMTGYTGYKVDADGTFKHWLDTDEGLEISKFVNKMYREGMIDPDFLSVDYETLMTKMQSEQIIGNWGTWWYAWTGGHQFWATQDAANYNINKRFANVSVHANNVDMKDTTLVTSNFIGNYRTIITDKTSQLGMIMRYLNWENSELGNFIVGWGAPGKDNVWDIADDGTWTVKDDILNVDTKETTFHQVRDKENGAGTYIISTNAQWMKTNDLQNFDKIDPRIGRVSIYDYWPMNKDGSFADEGINLGWEHYTAPAKDTTLYSVSFAANDPITITNQTIKDSLQTEWATIITASTEEECVARFNEAKTKLDSMGLAELMTYMQTQHETNATKFAGK